VRVSLIRIPFALHEPMSRSPLEPPRAKRYSGTVPVDAVRTLAGVMDDKQASRGVLVTTSWFGKATHDSHAADRECFAVLVVGCVAAGLLAW